MKFDKLLKPFRPHKETKYYFNDLNWAYTEDGSFVTPFVINHEKTAIKDIKTDKIQTIPCREIGSQRPLEDKELKEALKLLYSMENIKEGSIGDITMNLPRRGDILPHVLNTYQGTVVSYSNVKPLISTLKRHLSDTHKAIERRNARVSQGQEISDHSRTF